MTRSRSADLRLADARPADAQPSKSSSSNPRLFEAGGWLRAARRVPSPNRDDRPPATQVDTLVVHHISLPPERFAGDAIQALFTNTLDCSLHPAYEPLRELRVSAHFLIRRHGELLQFVGTDARAWHAGVSRLFERERCNDFSIGVELEGSLARPFTASQYRRLNGLVAALCTRHPLRFAVGHSDIAPGRKVDPGPHFDWQRLHEAFARHGIVQPFGPSTAVCAKRVSTD